MIDAHTHIQFVAYERDRDEVIQRAKDAGVKMITVGTQKETSRAGVELAKKYKGLVYATVGLHPIHTGKSFHDAQELGGEKGFTSRGEEFDSKYYLELARDPHVVGIGECGLDYFRIEGDVTQAKEKQKQVFRKHIEIAEMVYKPLMLHCRPSKGTDDAYEDMFAIVAEMKVAVPRISHFFVGSMNMTKKLVDAGFYFTFGGVITITRDYDEIVQYIPLDRILIETDAPYVSPLKYRGKRNESSYIFEIAKQLAEIKGIPQSEVERVVTQNAVTIFRL